MGRGVSAGSMDLCCDCLFTAECVHPCVCVCLCALICSGPQQQEHQRKHGLSFLCLSHCHNTHKTLCLRPTYGDTVKGGLLLASAEHVCVICSIQHIPFN